MSKLSSLFSIKAPRPLQTPKESALPEGVDPDDLKGADQRRLAELKAEAAGARARKQAEAEGVANKEIGGPKGLEPTRYGDWEKAGRCFDF